MSAAETATAHDQPSTSGGCLKMIGCGCLTLVLVTVLGGAYLYMNFHVFVASGLESEIDRQLDNYQVPTEVQTEVLEEMSVFTDKIRNKELPAWEAFANLFASIEGGIAVPAILGHYQFVGTYIDNGGLNDEEKPAVRLTAQRFLRGVIEETIPGGQAREIAERLESKLPDGSSHQPPQMRDDIQPSEIRTILADMRSAADAAGVPNEPYNPDLAGLVRQHLQSIGDAGGFETQEPQQDQRDAPALQPSGETL